MKHERFRTGLFWSASLASALILLLSNNPAFANTINVKLPPYSAKGDGKTNDQAAITKAINAGKAGDTIYFPTGNYLHSASLTFKASENALGDGATKSFLTATTATNGALVFTGTNVTIKALCVQYSNPVDSTAYSANGIYVHNITGFTVASTTVQKTSANGVSVNVASHGLITSSRISSPTETGVYLQRTTTTSVTSNVFPLTSTAVYVNNTYQTGTAQSIAITSNNIQNSSGNTATPGIYVVGVKGCTINSNTVSNNMWGGILVQGENLTGLGPSSNVTVHGNTVSNCGFNGSIYVDGSSDGGFGATTVTNVTVTSNTMTNNPATAILVLGEFANGVSGAVINANTVKNVPTAPGIWVDNTINATIGDLTSKTDGNTVDSTLNASIYTGIGCAGKLLVDNNVLSNAGASVNYLFPAHNAVIDVEDNGSGGTSLTSLDCENNSYTGSTAGLDDFIFLGPPKHLLTSETVAGNTTTTMLGIVITP
jgi:parallel beta-helix repeat protein